MSDTHEQVEWRVSATFAIPFAGGTAYGTDKFTVTAMPDIFDAQRAALTELRRRNPGAQARQTRLSRVDSPTTTPAAPDAQPSLWGN